MLFRTALNAPEGRQGWRDSRHRIVSAEPRACSTPDRIVQLAFWGVANMPTFGAKLRSFSFVLAVSFPFHTT